MRSSSLFPSGCLTPSLPFLFNCPDHFFCFCCSLARPRFVRVSLLSLMLFVPTPLHFSPSSPPFICIILDVPPSSPAPHATFPRLSSAAGLESTILRRSGPLLKAPLFRISPLFQSSDFLWSFCEEQSPTCSHFTERCYNPGRVIEESLALEEPEGRGVRRPRKFL